MSDFLKDIIKETGNEFADIVDDGVEAGDVANFIDTGSYIFNDLISGSLQGGLPGNKITDPSLAKVQLVKHSLY